MEKLKAKHDHKLTDILKVLIFALFLILPGLIVLPSMLYYGVNEHATAPTEQIEKIEYKEINFNQIVQPAYKSTNQTYNQYVQALKLDNYLIESHIYYINFDVENYNYYYAWSIGDPNTQPNDLTFGVRGIGNYNFNITYTNNYTNSIYFYRTGSGSALINIDNYFIVDLTYAFGIGNEPTSAEFKQYFTDEYYNYTTDYKTTIEINTGVYETYTDITSQIQYNWTSLWQQPLFSWTNYTIVKQGIDNFTGVFGITNTSNISNLIAYELIIVAIYIVIDIVLTLFKWLTHLIGEK